VVTFAEGEQLAPDIGAIVYLETSEKSGMGVRDICPAIAGSMTDPLVVAEQPVAIDAPSPTNPLCC
jgi:hypothetical protein